ISDNLRFIRFFSQDGLASDKVLNILQDQYGFMWFATENGLSRFDGIHFVNYLHSAKDKHSLSNNVVTALAEDRYGNLWIGTQNGLNRYDRNHNNFQQYTTQNGLKNNFVRALHADK
ncbi:ligand-binding sensor domain-containing protein, partial [Acinetobacter baumannii]|uniref:ligand-binding sensor domain-containing protein n=1 Tax=Acinetobacter baumannii TaxID=470 RepID=UPI00331846DB